MSGDEGDGDEKGEERRRERRGKRRGAERGRRALAFQSVGGLVHKPRQKCQKQMKIIALT